MVVLWQWRVGRHEPIWMSRSLSTRHPRFFLDKTKVLPETRQRALTKQSRFADRNEGNKAMALMDEALQGLSGQGCCGLNKVAATTLPR